MARFNVLWIILAICCVDIHFSWCQEKNNGDTLEIIKIDTTNKVIDAVKDTKIGQEILESVTRKPESESVINIKSEVAFLPFNGKIIRQILINHIDFEKSITDTSRNIKNTVVRIGNALHNTSKEWVIRDHVFFKEKKPLNAYLLAD